jgi:hypothetical protein
MPFIENNVIKVGEWSAAAAVGKVRVGGANETIGCNDQVFGSSLAAVKKQNDRFEREDR